MDSVAAVRLPQVAAAAALSGTGNQAASSSQSGPRAVPPPPKKEGASNDTERRADEEVFRELVRDMEAKLPFNVDFDIRYDEATNRTVFRAVSTVTGETVIEAPTDEMLKLIRGLRQDLGITVDERV